MYLEPNYEYTPMINRLIVSVDIPNKVSRGGIIVPDTAKKRPRVGTVISIHPETEKEYGVHAGDRVVFGLFAGETASDNPDDEDIHIQIMNISEIMAVRKEKKKEE